MRWQKLAAQPADEVALHRPDGLSTLYHARRRTDSARRKEVARAAGTVAKMNPRGTEDSRLHHEATQLLLFCKSTCPMPVQGRLFFCRLRDPRMLGHYRGVGGDAYLAAERPVERYDHRYQKRERGCDDAGHRQVHAEG